MTWAIGKCYDGVLDQSALDRKEWAVITADKILAYSQTHAEAMEFLKTHCKDGPLSYCACLVTNAVADRFFEKENV